MSWQEILSVLIPLGAIVSWFYNRIDRKFDKIENHMKEVKEDIKEIKKDLHSLDSRISRIEGQLNPPYHWEPKIKQKEE